MTPFLETMTLTYLIYPLLGLLFIGLGLFIAKKNALLGNKRLIGYILITVVILTAPAILGFLDYSYMPFGYIALCIIYLILGKYNINIISWVFEDDYKYRHEIILTLFATVIGMLFFTLVFNLCNELQYGVAASTCMLTFPFVSLFMHTYHLYLAIADPIYKVWRYGDDDHYENYENIDYGYLKLITIEIFRKETDLQPLTVKAKVPDQMPFGFWIKRFIDDYNIKNSFTPIDSNANDYNVGWIFNSHYSLFLPKHYIDYELTVKENRIKDGDFIIAKRVKESVEEID